MRTSLIAAIVFCSSVAFAQVNFTEKMVYADKKEVSNKDWVAFVGFISKDPGFSKKYVQSMIPEGWNNLKMNAETQNRAVTGVSWEQAVAYCQWKSELTTYLQSHAKAASYKHMEADNKLAKSFIAYRLPTEREFNKMNTKSGRTGFRCVYTVKKLS
jgi:formylglycine-generating enzyme required for sulfatase activity